MSLAKKTKTALDELRTLMLGAQILLGFQLQAPFQNDFHVLADTQQQVEVCVLCLMVVVVGLIIAPSARHRIVENGEASQAINRFITRIAVVMLALFAAALGLDLYIAMSLIAGNIAGAIAGTLGALIAVGLWLGPAIFQRSSREDVMQDDLTPTPSGRKVEYVLTESRVVLPGAQAILGFQLAIILTQSFREMPFSDQLIHAGALAQITLATALLIAPASIHRIVYRGEDVPQFYRTASAILLVATVFLASGLSTDIFVVMKKITGSDALAVLAAAASACVLFGLWHVWPWATRRGLPGGGAAS